jgi:hypothetical protein
VKIAEYKVIKEKDVMKHVEDGWVLQGGGFASHQGFFMQVIVKYETEDAIPADDM